VGDIVTVTVQSREIRAIVTDIQDAKQMKGAVKTGNFPLKKILKVEKGFLSASLIESAKETAEYYVTSVSKVLGAMFPKNVLAEAECIHLDSRFPSSPSPSGRGGGEVYLEGAQSDRWNWILKNVLQKNKKVLYVSSSNHELAKAKMFFAKHTQGSLLGPTEDCLVCVSPEYGFVWLPYVDTIILDHESGAGYHDRSNAKIDFKKVYELHAKKNNQQIFFADSVLDLKYSAQGTLVCSLTAWPKVTVVKKERKVDHNSWLVSKEAVQVIEKTGETVKNIPSVVEKLSKDFCPPSGNFLFFQPSGEEKVLITCLGALPFLETIGKQTGNEIIDKHITFAKSFSTFREAEEHISQLLADII